MRHPLRVLLVSTYELGRQPFGLAEPAAVLSAEVGAEVRTLDLAVQDFDEAAFSRAELIAVYLPMHTATRLAARLVPRVRALNSRAHLAAYGLYAPLNAPYLRRLGITTILGGEFEAGLTRLAKRVESRIASGAGASDAGVQTEAEISLDRQAFRVPDRSGLPPLERYAHLHLPNQASRTVGYVEASRGCKNLCRHCPVVPIYRGKFRVVPHQVVLEDIRQQVAAGAAHITFGDPDFLNGPGHAIPLVESLHAEFPDLTYDVTIKIEHLLQSRQHLSILRDTGCLFVTSAVESADDAVLEILAKGHTRADFVRAAALMRDVGLILQPTFVTFTPWTSLEGYLELLELIAELDLVEHVAPIQYAIRLLIPAGSMLLELPAVRELVDEFDEEALVHPWSHPDPRMDRLHAKVLEAVKPSRTSGMSRGESFQKVRGLARQAREGAGIAPPLELAPRRSPIPYLTEPWYC